METVSGKAEQLGFYAAVLGDAGRAFAQLERYRRVSAEDVLRVAQTLFRADRRTTIFVRSGSSVETEAA
jgi:zinc protease